MARVSARNGFRPRFGFIRKRFGLVGDVISELKKVMWPTREEWIRLSLMVLGVCAVMAVFLGLADRGFGELVLRVFIGG